MPDAMEIIGALAWAAASASGLSVRFAAADGFNWIRCFAVRGDKESAVCSIRPLGTDGGLALTPEPDYARYFTLVLGEASYSPACLDALAQDLAAAFAAAPPRLG